MNISLEPVEKFEERHNSPTQKQIEDMLTVVGSASLDQLINETVPEKIRLKSALALPEPQSESDFLKTFKKLAAKNKVFRSFLGMGYYDCHTPQVIQRNILENPGWYTAYTPYQAEIAQGRLEMLLTFQTMVMDLTGMEIANASLLDEGTAAAEAMSMFMATRKRDKKNATKFFVAETCHPQTIEVIKTRAVPMGIDLVIGSLNDLDLTDTDLFGLLVQYPDTNGSVTDYTSLFATASEYGVKIAAAADLLSLTLLKAPGEMGADVVVGSSQRFGVPMGYGGPHAAFFATKEDFKRHIPGRIIGVSKDIDGNEAYRMALQTREQHIRREKATSNICTAQVLLAVMAAAYAVYHGPERLRKTGERVHGLARVLAKGLEQLGFKQANEAYFDTLKVEIPSQEIKDKINQGALAKGMNFRVFDTPAIGIALDEVATIQEVEAILGIFADVAAEATTIDIVGLTNEIQAGIPEGLLREADYLTHPVFNSYHNEHDMLRYLKSLENKDLSLVHSMISLGSCTMKLNATTEMVPVTWPEFGGIHPFAPADQAEGYKELFNNLESWLCEITGFDAVSLQPNSGAQGEYAGLMTIRAFHHNNGENHRNVALIPSSAHGTNPASAVMAGMKVVIVKCDDKGNIDLDDLRDKAEKYKESLSALMVTYPSTHGVFEEQIMEICELVHENGGRVYMDGANMNAQVGLTSPARIGADVCHLNLHKTFCIPHGGGGPGMGPIGVTSELAPFLPGHTLVETGGANAITSVSAAPFGSSSILTISYAYIAMMGAEGLTNATKLAILNANYIKSRLEGHYKILYTGKSGRSAHEMIIDCREFKKSGIEVEDIAKRLMDYGFHAPTVSFPVAGTMMIEPTESESKPEIDRFCEALVGIREEIREVEEGQADQGNNVLKNAPHTAALVTATAWNFPYSREKAAYPATFKQEKKFWPSVRRIDSAFGDRHLICSCTPTELYAEEAVEAVQG